VTLPISPARVALIVAVLVGIGFVSVLVGPTVRKYHQLTAPVIIRPAVVGSASLHGKPLAGVEIRMATVHGMDGPTCSALPLVATSDILGSFHAPALRRSRIFVQNKQIFVHTCFVRNGTELGYGWVAILWPGEVSSWTIQCALPAPEPWRPGNDPCFIMDANHSIQRTRYARR
jgi:hypothetical protein